jgi:hypothetical protein
VTALQSFKELEVGLSLSRTASLRGILVHGKLFENSTPENSTVRAFLIFIYLQGVAIEFRLTNQLSLFVGS